MRKSSSYYLAHSVDLTHPDRYLNMRINENLTKKEQIFYDNKRDNGKVQNRSFSPDEMKEVSIKNLNSINNFDISLADKTEKRNMGYSKEMPYRVANYEQLKKDLVSSGGSKSGSVYGGGDYSTSKRALYSDKQFSALKSRNLDFSTLDDIYQLKSSHTIAVGERDQSYSSSNLPMIRQSSSNLALLSNV